MDPHDIEIEIGKDGKVHAHIRGAKGKGCLDYAKLLESIVGREVSREMTAEHFEPDGVVEIRPTIENKR
jgi:hypothetical protein